MPGVMMAAPLIALPLCVAVVHRFVLRLTRDRTAAFFAAAGYFALPLVGEGTVAGYVDFAFCALLCFYVDTLLRSLPSERRVADLVRLGFGTLVFTLARGQAVYAAGALLVVMAALTHLRRDRLRLRFQEGASWEQMLPPFLAFGLGAIPSLCLQVYRFVKYGGPIYPYQFQLFGVTFGTGIPMKSLFSYAGVEDTPRGLVMAFVHGWLWPATWPPLGFYDSRNLGVGFIFWMTLLVAIPAFRALDRRAIVLVSSLGALSFFARDFVHPRWASSLLLAVVIVFGVGMAQLTRSRLGRFAFAPLALLLLAHMFRPELELKLIDTVGLGPRLNAMSSPWFRQGREGFGVWPDLHARFLIVQEKGFVLPVYGPKLTNEVVKTIPSVEIGSNCERLIAEGALKPDTFVLDDLDTTKTCPRECVQRDSWHCEIWRLKGGK
jgi:hypothetical protein